MLRKRCIELSREVYSFGAAVHRSSYKDEQETIDRFRLRHQGKVSELREELSRRGWLTAREREILTLSPDDSWHKILQMAETLKAIGSGH